VASTATAWRVIERVAGDQLGLAGLRAARAQARGRAWRLGAHADGLLLVDVDGTLLDAHSAKRGAAGTYKHGFGFYPLLAFLDRGDSTGEALAGLLRAGNAGSNTAAGHIEVVDLALAQLPRAAGDQPILVRADSGGATMPSPTTCASAACGSRSACPPTSGSAPRSWPSATTRGPQRSTPTASRARRRGRRAFEPRPGWLAARDPGDLPPRAAPSRRATVVHRRRRASLPGVRHRPARQRPRPAGAAPPPACPHPGPHPRRQGHGLAEPPVRPVAPQRRLARAGPHGLRPCCWAQALLLDGALAVAEPKTLR
jgi:Transposase DDE domain group 1